MDLSMRVYRGRLLIPDEFHTDVNLRVALASQRYAALGRLIYPFEFGF